VVTQSHATFAIETDDPAGRAAETQQGEPEASILAFEFPHPVHCLRVCERGVHPLPRLGWISISNPTSCTKVLAPEHEVAPVLYIITPHGVSNRSIEYFPTSYQCVSMMR
jgi:hypothetical protein